MTSISALITAQNEAQYIEKCILAIEPYVEEIIFVNNESQDKTREIVENLKNPKIKIFDHPYTENMGELRQFSLDQATQDWIWQIDADEIYPPEACETIREAVKTAGERISFRVQYHNLSWRIGYEQENFTHAPDRLYRRDVIDKYDGVLPNDMTKVKPEFYRYRPFLEYDNRNDQSHENAKQPILNAWYYHLARTKGYNFEYNKWLRYNKNMHPDWSEDQLADNARLNGWVSGMYSLEKIDVPFETPILSPKVSIIIPNFQYRDFVGKAIESCQNQTVKPYEIIVVDDGSHDDSVAVISKYDVKLIRTANHGVACARNEGAKNATGDYLIFLDADDELAPNYIEKVLGEMNGDTQVVYTDIQFIGDANFVNAQPEYSLEEMRKWQVVPSTCALLDRHVWEMVGGFDNTEHYEDWGFWLRVAIQGYNFKHIREPLFKYRKHGKSRIDLLDERKSYGFKQLRERYQITRTD